MFTTLGNALRYVFVGSIVLGGGSLGCHGCQQRRFDKESTAKCASATTEEACKTCCNTQGDRGHVRNQKCRCMDRKQ